MNNSNDNTENKENKENSVNNENRKFGEVSEEDIKLASQATPEDLKEKPKKSFLDEVLEWTESFVFAVFVMLLIFTFFFRIVVVDGSSMNDTLTDKDRLILSHIAYTPEKDDIVVINSPRIDETHGLNKTIIKRVIGTAGDTVVVNYNENTVYVNGEKISNDKIKPEPMQDKAGYLFDLQYCTAPGVYQYNVPEGCVFVMGDNRNNSTDSRSQWVGFVKVEDVLGKAIFRMYPVSDFGTIK